jgi:hypothetical protein
VEKIIQAQPPPSPPSLWSIMWAFLKLKKYIDIHAFIALMGNKMEEEDKSMYIIIFV